MALGAQPRDVLQHVIGEGSLLASTGIALGLLTDGIATRVLTSLLFGVKPTDPLTFFGVAFAFLDHSSACYIPARRATRLDPMVAGTLYGNEIERRMKLQMALKTDGMSVAASTTTVPGARYSETSVG